MSLTYALPVPARVLESSLAFRGYSYIRYCTVMFQLLSIFPFQSAI